MIAIVGVNVIETVATADDVHVPVPDITVYVVVELGVTVTLAALAGAVPVLALQTKGPVPEADKPTLCPAQTEDSVGVIAVGGGVPTETVATAEAVHDPAPAITV